MSELTRTVGLVATSAAVGALAGFLLGTRVNVGSRLRLPVRRVGPNLLENPSFEEGDTSGNFQTPLDGGATNIRHWPVVGAPGTQAIAYSFEQNTGFDPAHGFRFIDLTNSGFSKGPYGGVEQTVTLIPGADYELTLQIGGMLPRSGSQVKARVGIVPMGPSREFTVQMNSNGTKTWGPCTLEFVAPAIAPGASLKVRIDAPTPQTNSQGPSKLIAIDDVQLYRLSPFLRP